MMDVNADGQQIRRALQYMVEGGYFSRMATKRVQVWGLVLACLLKLWSSCVFFSCIP